MATRKIPSTAQATKGTQISWAAGTTIGVKPVTGWKQIPGITSWPRIGGTADSFESTTIDEDQLKTYVIGLLDSGGAQDVTYAANAQTVDEVFAMYEAQTEGKEVWIKVDILPPMAMQYYCTIQVSPPAGIPAIGVNGLLEDTFSITYAGNFSKEEVI